MKRFLPCGLLMGVGIVLSYLALPIPLVKADRRSPSHYCSKPSKPYRFTDQSELRSFQDDVDRYKSCIEEFVEEQETAIKNHRRAANDAIDEWNSFVRYG